MAELTYTPALEEIHHGFRLQWFNGELWKDVIYDHYEHCDLISDGIANGHVRVKKLDRVDIESLGWKFEEESKVGPVFSDGYKFLHIYDGVLWIDNGDEEEYMCDFRGVVKNRSELERVMNFLAG